MYLNLFTLKFMPVLIRLKDYSKTLPKKNFHTKFYLLIYDRFTLSERLEKPVEIEIHIYIRYLPLYTQVHRRTDSCVMSVRCLPHCVHSGKQPYTAIICSHFLVFFFFSPRIESGAHSHAR